MNESSGSIGRTLQCHHVGRVIWVTLTSSSDDCMNKNERILAGRTPEVESESSGAWRGVRWRSEGASTRGVISVTSMNSAASQRLPLELAAILSSASPESLRNVFAAIARLLHCSRVYGNTGLCSEWSCLSCYLKFTFAIRADYSAAS